MSVIDLNADLGEIVDTGPTSDDEAMFAVISSASIACGGHAGDADSMRAATARAIAHGVAIGAHPSYDDRAEFGRVRRDPPTAELRLTLVRQLAALAEAGADIRYVKPHGALYHAVRDDEAQAIALADAVVALADGLGRPVPVLGQDGVITRVAAERSIPFLREAFLDRGYLPDGSLVPRGAEGALLSDPALVAERAVRLALEGVVVAIDGSLVDVDAASLCVHGDSPAAVEMARAVRTALDTAGVGVRASW